MLVLILIGKKRIGNLEGTRGVSELHVQEPLPPTYRLEEADEIFDNEDEKQDI